MKHNVVSVTKRRQFGSQARERGSLALEQVLFISAVVILTAGVYAFYTELAGYFENFGVTTPPQSFGAASAG